LSSLWNEVRLLAARGLATQWLTSSTVSAKEIVMRPSRFPTALFATLVLVLCHASQAQTVRTIQAFNGTTGGLYPNYGSLTQGTDGQLYGITVEGGTYGLGTVYRQSSTGANNVVLHNFSGPDGSFPYANPTLGRDGYFYGNTALGGTFNFGTLYKMDRVGNVTVLYNFTGGADSENPYAAPIQATDGNFYGTTIGNVGPIYPTVYKLSPSGAFSTIYTFPTSDAIPWGGLIQASDGNLYVNSQDGGTNGCGAITTLTTAGVVKATYSFDCTSGGAPIAKLVEATDGNLYGTTAGGGTHGRGTVFRLNPSTGAVTTLYSFDAQSGSGGASALAQGSDGDLYGTTENGGAHNVGSLFQLTLGGAYTRLYSFYGKIIPGAGQAGLLQHTGGMFYGTTDQGGTFEAGTIYSLNMGLGPFVTFIRASGRIGQTAQILGRGLTGTTSVTFNGVPATNFTVVSDTYMTAVVPTGATTGKIVVTTPTGTLTSNVRFRIIQ
jgi:uncharacterized repeat protein (TIGR03803 family)